MDIFVHVRNPEVTAPSRKEVGKLEGSRVNVSTLFEPLKHQMVDAKALKASSGIQKVNVRNYGLGLVDLIPRTDAL